MELYTKGNATSKNVQHTVESVDALITTTISQVDTLLARFVGTLPDAVIKDNHALKALTTHLRHAHGSFVDLSTEYQRMKYFSSKGMVLPESYKIGERHDVRSDGSNIKVNVEAQYVPLIPMLSKYYDYYSKLNFTLRTDGILASYFDASKFKTSAFHSENPSALRLILYHDDIEVANPLGSRAGVHKLTMFYYTVHGQSDSKLQLIHLAIVCHASDVKEYGYASILKPFIRDLKALYCGVEIQMANTSVPGPTMMATLEHVVGDNLAANAILGMNQSFSGGHFCRFCYISGDEVHASTHCRNQRRRSETSHRLDVDRVLNKPELSSTCGVKQPCALDEIEYFSGIKATVPDVM